MDRVIYSVEPVCVNPNCRYNKVLVYSPMRFFNVIDTDQIGVSDGNLAYRTKTINRVSVIRCGIKYLYCEDCAKLINEMDFSDKQKNGFN